MSNLFTDIIDNIGSNNIAKISQSVGIEKNETTESAMKLLFSAVAEKNSKDKEKSAEFFKVLQKDHKNNLDNISNILSGTLDKKPNGILKHILGENKEVVLKKYAKQNKISLDQTEDLFKKVAPILLGSFSKTIEKTNMDANVFGKILDMAYSVDLKDGKADSVIAFLDFNKDGRISDNINGIFSFFKRFFKK